MLQLGFSLESKYELPFSQVIPLLKSNGFSAVSPVWSPELDLQDLNKWVQKENMVIQSLHAPHKDIATLWQPDTQVAHGVKTNILTCLQDCYRNQIPIMVIHCWQGHNYTFSDEGLDFSFYDEIVKTAEELGVSVAFENLEGEEYLQAIMERYQGHPFVGFCWDSGHDHCYPHKTDFLTRYADRLIMTHLNDNRGVQDPDGKPSKFDDLHFLPGDGIVNWEQQIARLANARRQTILNFELKKTAKSKKSADLLYENMGIASFLEEAGKRAKSIADIYQFHCNHKGETKK